MATFQVYKDVDEENRNARAHPIKLKESKIDAPRLALGEINTNKVLEGKPQGSKVFDGKQPKFQDKDVSEAFKEVKLDSKEDECTKDKKEPSSLEQNSLDNSDFSLDTPTGPPQYSKLYTEGLFDCLSYRDDIYAYLKELELKRKPKAFYMKKQPDITYTMRSILVDWLVEVAEEYKLNGETLFVAVSYVDRFLSTMAVVRSKLQLLGTAAMLIASKYEEIYPPELSEFTYITDDTYSKKQVLRMEQLILKTLNFDISVPTHYTFIKQLAKAADISESVSWLALYICELCVTEGDPYLEHAASVVACAALALARHCLGVAPAWPADLARASGYSLTTHLAPVLPHLNRTHAGAPSLSLSASREKYKSPRLMSVSLVPHKPLVVRSPTS